MSTVPFPLLCSPELATCALPSQSRVLCLSYVENFAIHFFSVSVFHFDTPFKMKAKESLETYIPRNILSDKINEPIIATIIMFSGLEAVTKTGPFSLIITR